MFRNISSFSPPRHARARCGQHHREMPAASLVAAAGRCDVVRVTDLASPFSVARRRAVAVPARETRRAAAGAGLVALRLAEERQWLPLAFVAVISLAHGLMHPSLRAAVAFAAGALSLVGAAIAIADARWN